MLSFKRNYIGVIRQMSGGFLSTFLLFTSVSCTNDHNQSLYVKLDCQVNDLAHISFSREVYPIISSNCLSCHNAVNHFGGVVLENYSQIKGSSEIGEMMDVITSSWVESPPRMPKGSPMKSCEVDIIRLWIKQGMLNN